MPNVTAPPPDVGSMTRREMVELAINNALPNIDDLPERAEYDITQSQLESELAAIAASASEIRPVVRGRPSAVSVSESVAAMDAASASQTAMDAVSTSATAMDAVSSSQTARDAVNASQLAFDTVAAVNMAIGKFVAGSAGLTPSNFADMVAVSASQAAMDAVSASTAAMDAASASQTAMGEVSASQTAMDAVSTSATAMDVVTTSTTAMDAVASAVMPRTSVLFGGYYDKIFGSEVGSDRFYNNSAINPNSGSVEGLPYDYNASGDNNKTYEIFLSTNTPSSFDGGKSIVCQSNDFENRNQAFAEIELDLSNASTLEYWAEDNGDSAVLLIDGDTVNSMGTKFDWTQFSVDVSGYSGTSNIGLGSNYTTGRNRKTYYTGLELS